MTSDSILMPTEAAGPASATPTRVLAVWHRPLAAVLALAGAALAWLGGPAALVGVLAVLAAAWLAWHGMAVAGPTLAETRHEDVGRHGAEVMVSRVVPVWSRQMEVTRDAASEGLAQILETFATMSGALGTLTDNLSNFAVHADPGAVDSAVRRESPALGALAAASQRAFDERDAVVAELGRCATGLAELQQLAKHTRELARHTRLVAFNASIEANRQGNRAAGGSQAVANELRMLSTRMGETGDRIERVVQALSASVGKARREGEINDTSPEELRLEIDLSARQALQALLGGLGSSLQSSTEVEQASRTLRDQLDAAFVHFQFGDRVSQMLNIVANDMTNFVRWVAANPRATQTDAAEWLAALEASYTMHEQRATHHGNVTVDVGSNVDFF